VEAAPKFGELASLVNALQDAVSLVREREEAAEAGRRTAEARADGINVGLLRPITLFPFPTLDFQRLVPHARVFVVVEMSNGQLIEDVRLALNGARPVELLNRMGGNVPSHEEVLEFVRGLAHHGGQARRTKAAMQPQEEQMAHV